MSARDDAPTPPLPEFGTVFTIKVSEDMLVKRDSDRPRHVSNEQQHHRETRRPEKRSRRDKPIPDISPPPPRLTRTTSREVREESPQPPAAVKDLVRSEVVQAVSPVVSRISSASPTPVVQKKMKKKKKKKKEGKVEPEKVDNPVEEEESDKSRRKEDHHIPSRKEEKREEIDEIAEIKEKIKKDNHHQTRERSDKINKKRDERDRKREEFGVKVERRRDDTDRKREDTQRRRDSERRRESYEKRKESYERRRGEVERRKDTGRRTNSERRHDDPVKRSGRSDPKDLRKSSDDVPPEVSEATKRDSTIKKNIRELEKAKREKRKKIISETINSSEEEELLRAKKKKVTPSPPPPAQDPTDSSKPECQVKNFCLKSKREFEQKKAELNKGNPSDKDMEIYEEPPEKKKKEFRPIGRVSPLRQEQPQPENGGELEGPVKEIPEKDGKEEVETAPLQPTESTTNNDVTKPADVTKPDDVTQEVATAKMLTEEEAREDEDVVTIMREEDSLSGIGEEPKVEEAAEAVKPDTPAIAEETKKKKAKEDKKKKKKKEKKKQKKKKKRKHSSDSSSSDDEDDRKKKVKIDKSELNKIVQFLKQRDEAQKLGESAGAEKGGKKSSSYNPKLINKDSKQIAINIKSGRSRR